MGICILSVEAGKIREVSPEEFMKGHRTNYDDKRLRTVAKDSTVPNVGDVVRFNDHGLETVFGSVVGKSFMKKLEMRITHVDDVSMTYPEPTFTVEVDDPDINQFMLYSACFDIVRRA